MAMSAIADEYFRSMNPLAGKIYDDIIEAKTSYENIWETLTEKEKVSILLPTLCFYCMIICYSIWTIF